MNVRRFLISAAASVTATVALLSMGTSAQAAAAPTKSERVATHTAWVAEHKSNRHCADLAPTATTLGTGKWERCVTREFKRLTGTPMDAFAVECHSVCGLEGGASMVALPSKKAAGALSMWTLKASDYAPLLITASPYGNLLCRVYEYPQSKTVRCSNGLIRH